MKKLISLIFLTIALIFIGCGGVDSESSSPSNETVTGYVIDDPVVGATIEAYDENGNLIAKEENATDQNGKFNIQFQKNNSNYYLVKSINGKINKKYYNFSFIAIQLKNNNDKLYITPYSTLVFNILQAQQLAINKKNIEYCKNLIKNLLGINDLNHISPDFSKYLQEHGINNTIKRLTVDIIEQKGDKKLASIFPHSKILQPKIGLNNKLPSNSNTFKIITPTGTNEIDNTPSLISGIVADKNGTKIYGYSSNIPSLKNKINFDTTAMALIGMGLKEKYSIDNLKLQYIYDSIEDTNEYKNLFNSIKMGYENNISLLNNDAVYNNLKKVFYYINKNNLLKSNVNTLSEKLLNKVNVSKILPRITNTEVFPYPSLKFNFKDASIINYNGNVEFSIDNPAFVGYVFTTKENYFSEANGFINKLINKNKNIYIPFAKLYKSEDYVKDISKTYTESYVNYIKTGQMDLKDDKPIKKLGKSEETVYTLLPYNCGNNMKCWKGKFIEYDNGVVPNLYNSLYTINDIIATVSGLNTLKQSKYYTHFIKFLISLKDKLGEFKSMLLFLRNFLDYSNTIFFSELSDISNKPQFYSAYKQVQSKMNEIQKLLNTINTTLEKLKNIPEYKPGSIVKDSANYAYIEEMFNAFSEGNLFKAIEIAQQNGGKIKTKDVFLLYIENLFYPKLSYKGKIYSGLTFFKDKKIPKTDKNLVRIATIAKILFPEAKKEPNKFFNELLASRNITINRKKLDKGINTIESLANFTSAIDKVTNFIESWSNRGLYIDPKLGGLFLEWIKEKSIDITAKIPEDAINAYLTTREIGKKALLALNVTSEGIQLSLMAGSYMANPKVLPYEIIAKENKKDKKIDFKARMAMDSIGLSKVYLLDSNGLIYGRESLPNTLIVKKGYSFYPSMEIIFPKGYLKDYLNNTLFTAGDYIYNFMMFINKYGDNLKTAYVYGVGNSENTDNPSIFSVWHSALIGNNSAYIKKMSCPSKVINQIKTDGNNEYLDIYDLSTINTNDAKVRSYDSKYISLHNSHPLVTLPDAGIYSIKMRTIIGQSYTAYINQNNVTYNTWEHSFKVIVLSPISDYIKTLAKNYKFYKINNNKYIMNFPDIAKTGNYYIIPVIKPNSIVDAKILPYNEGNLTSYILDNFADMYVYIISKNNYKYLSSYDNGEVPIYLLDKLVKNGIAYKLKVSFIKNNPPVINDHSIKTDNLTATLSVQTTDPDNDPLTCSVNWGDGSSNEFDCNQNISHTYSNDGEYNVIITATDDNNNLNDKMKFILNLQNKNSKNNDKAIVITENQSAKITLPNINIGSCDINFGDGYSENYNYCPTKIEHIYKKPGVYNLSITNSNSEKKYKKVIIVNNADPSYWDGYVSSLNNYIQDNEEVQDFYKNGELYISPSLSNVSYYWTNFVYVNINAFKNINANNFILTAKLKNSEDDGGLSAYDASLRIYTDDGESIGASLMGESWAQEYTHIWAGNSHADDLSELILDLNNYKTIKYVVKDNNFTLYSDGKKLYTLPFNDTFGKIVGIGVSFKGSGTLDNVNIYNENNESVYNNNF